MTMRRLLLTLCAISLMMLSCTKDDMNDMSNVNKPMGSLLPGQHQAYVMVGKYQGNYCELTDDLDRKWLLDTYIINGLLPEGRSLLTYELYDGHIDGYDVLANLNAITLFSISDAIVSPTVAQQETLGSDPVKVQKMHLAENGKWVDISFEVFTNNAEGGTHQLSLAVFPTGDTCRCVLFHKGQNMSNGTTRLSGNLSFRLPDDVNPVKNGLQGIRFQYVDLQGNHQDIFLSPSSTPFIPQ